MSGRSFLSWFGWGRPRAAPVRTYAQDLGWMSRRASNGQILHEGFFCAARQRWQGRILQTGPRFDFRILNPPIGVIRGTEWEGCFHAISRDGWWRITFRPWSQPRDLDSGITAINAVLQTCFQRAAVRSW